MPLISATNRTLQVKIVYYGPGLSGKTTNLELLSKLLDPQRVGDLMTLDTTGDRTLFFDWMPVELGTIKGFEVRIQLYTVPGQVRYNNTRKKVLQGADGLVFVADSQEEALDQNRYAFQNLRENLAEQGIDLEDLPLVIQWNKRDLPTALSPSSLAARLNLEHCPQVNAVAYKGEGVRETLRLITRLVLGNIRAKLDPGAEQVDEASQMPLDGDSLMHQIMTGAQGEEPPDADEMEMPEILVDAMPPVAGAADDSSWEVSSVETTRNTSQLSVLEREVRALYQAVRSMRESLPARISDAVEREVEPTAEKVADLESRLGIMQRVVTRLSGRADVLERRVARLEIGDRQPGRSAEIKEMAGQFHDLSRLMAAFARRLSQSQTAPRSSQPVAGDGDQNPTEESES